MSCCAWEPWYVKLTQPVARLTQGCVYPVKVRDGAVFALTDTHEVRLHSGEYRVLVERPAMDGMLGNKP